MCCCVGVVVSLSGADLEFSLQSPEVGLRIIIKQTEAQVE